MIIPLVTFISVVIFSSTIRFNPKWYQQRFCLMSFHNLAHQRSCCCSSYRWLWHASTLTSSTCARPGLADWPDIALCIASAILLPCYHCQDQHLHMLHMPNCVVGIPHHNRWWCGWWGWSTWFWYMKICAYDTWVRTHKLDVDLVWSPSSHSS